MFGRKDREHGKYNEFMDPIAWNEAVVTDDALTMYVSNESNLEWCKTYADLNSLKQLKRASVFPTGAVQWRGQSPTTEKIIFA